MTVRLIGVNEAQKVIQGRADRLMRALVLETASRLIMKTPVDTGRARGNWQVDTKPVDGGTETADKDGGKTLASALAVLQSLDVTVTIWITNGLPYIKALNDGHSKQAPQGMVSTTVAELEAFGARVIKEIQQGG